MTKKLKLLRFLSFQFGPIRNIENCEISESFPLLSISTLVVTQDLKQQRNELRQRLIRFKKL